VEGHLFLAASGYPHRWLVPSPQHTKLTKQDLIIGCDVMAHIGAAVFDFSRQQIRLRDRTRKVDYLFEMSGHNKCIIKTAGPKWWALGYADPRFGWPQAPPPPPGGGGDDGGNGGDDDQGGNDPYEGYVTDEDHDTPDQYEPQEYAPQAGERPEQDADDLQDEPVGHDDLPEMQGPQRSVTQSPRTPVSVPSHGNSPSNSAAGDGQAQYEPQARRNPNRSVRRQTQDFQAGPAPRQ
jgi:hypothetical protein